jgi:hypothetical protein
MKNKDDNMIIIEIPDEEIKDFQMKKIIHQDFKDIRSEEDVIEIKEDKISITFIKE